MTTVLAIDPGSAGKGCACAAFTDGVLTEVWFERVPCFAWGAAPAAAKPALRDRWERAGACDLIVVEKPQIRVRTRGTRPIPPGVIVQLAWDGALLAGAFAGRDGAAIVAVEPSEWKRSEPKPVHHQRLWNTLLPAEMGLLGAYETKCAIARAVEKGALDRWDRPGVEYYPRAFTTHNLLDAVALGATYLGRLRRT